MRYLRKSEDRGSMENDWLKARHSFSFGNYVDREHMGFSALRVINQDVFQPGNGFPTHPHENMEIITYVTRGTIAHKDSTGGEGQITAGEIQVMSAGSGIAHSEFNPSTDNPLELLQIWIQPNVIDAKPGYSQKLFPAQSGLTTLVSPDGSSDSLRINQQAWLHRLLLDDGESTAFESTQADRATYVHIVKGSVELDGQQLSAGDAMGIQGEKALEFMAVPSVEALVFDLPPIGD